MKMKLTRTLIAELATARALTASTKLLGQVLFGDLSEEFLLVARAEDVDLGDGDGVEELLDDGEGAAEAPGGVDDVQLAQALRVVVLRDAGGGLQVAVDGAEHADADALEVHDGARRLEQVAGLAGARGQARVGHLLVLDHQVLQHALVRRDLVHGVQVDLAQLLDVQRPAVLVRLVVVLRVVGEHLGLLLVIEGGDEVVETAAKLGAPLLAVNEPVGQGYPSA